MRACGGNCLGMRNEELGIRNYIGPRRSLPLCRARPPGRAVLRTFPLGGRWPSAHTGPDEGAACGTFVDNGIPQSPPRGGDSPFHKGAWGGHTGPPLQVTTDRNFRRGGPMWPPAGRWGRFPLSGGNVERSKTKGVGIIGPYEGRRPCRVRPPGRAGPSPWGEGGPQGRMRGRPARHHVGAHSVRPCLSPGEALCAWGATNRRALLHCPISPSVICFANATSLVRGRLFCGPPPSAALCLPPIGGKVAFAEQMTDEGAEGRTAHYPRGHPHQSRFARQLPPFRGKPLWGAHCAPLRVTRTMEGGDCPRRLS